MEFLVFPCQNDHEWNSTKYLGNLQKVTIYENNIILYDFLLNENNKALGIINEIIRRYNRVSTEKITKTKYIALKVI